MGTDAHIVRGLITQRKGLRRGQRGNISGAVGRHYSSDSAADSQTISATVPILQRLDGGSAHRSPPVPILLRSALVRLVSIGQFSALPLAAGLDYRGFYVLGGNRDGEEARAVPISFAVDEGTETAVAHTVRGLVLQRTSPTAVPIPHFSSSTLALLKSSERTNMQGPWRLVKRR
jgi:hypothetical protein